MADILDLRRCRKRFPRNSLWRRSLRSNASFPADASDRARRLHGLGADLALALHRGCATFFRRAGQISDRSVGGKRNAGARVLADRITPAALDLRVNVSRTRRSAVLGASRRAGQIRAFGTAKSRAIFRSRKSPENCRDGLVPTITVDARTAM